MIYDLVDMTEWKTKTELLKELKNNGSPMNERIFRARIEAHNERYYNHETDKYIAHSSKGYKVTTNEEEIRKTADDFRKRAIDQFTKYHKTKKALEENANVSFLIEKGELICTEV